MRKFVMIGGMACGYALGSIGGAIFAASTELQYSRSLSVPTQARESLAAVALDSDAYEHLRENWSDLRLVVGDAEAAYVVRRATIKGTRTVEQTWKAQEIALQPLENGGLEIVMQTDPEQHPDPPQGVRLVTQLRDFEHRITIEASADGSAWETLLAEGLIFDYAQFMDVRNLSLRFTTAPTKLQRRIRATIANVTQEQQTQLLELSRNLQGGDEVSRTERVNIVRQPFRIDDILFWREAIQDADIRDRLIDYPLQRSKVEQDPETKRTFVYLASRREPLSELRVETAEKNFSRQAHVEIQWGEEPSSKWVQIGAGNLTHIDLHDVQRQSLTIPVSETRASSYRIVIENQDSPPLDIVAVRARGPQYEVAFLAAPQAEYRLHYGNRSLDAPHYDTAALALALEQGVAPLAAKLGEQSESAAPPAPSEPLATRLLGDARVVIAAIALLTIVLGWGLYGAAKRVDKIGQE